MPTKDVPMYELSKAEKRERWIEISKFIQEEERALFEAFSELFEQELIDETEVYSVFDALNKVTFTALKNIITSRFIMPMKKYLQCIVDKKSDMAVLYDNMDLGTLVKQLEGQPSKFKKGLLKWLHDLYDLMWAEDENRRSIIEEYLKEKEKLQNREKGLIAYMKPTIVLLEALYRLISDPDAMHNLVNINKEFEVGQKRVEFAKNERTEINSFREEVCITYQEVIDTHTQEINRLVRLFRKRRSVIQDYIDEAPDLENADIELLLADKFPDEVISHYDLIISENPEIVKLYKDMTERFEINKQYCEHLAKKAAEQEIFKPSKAKDLIKPKQKPVLNPPAKKEAVPVQTNTSSVDVSSLIKTKKPENTETKNEAEVFFKENKPEKEIIKKDADKVAESVENKKVKKPSNGASSPSNKKVRSVRLKKMTEEQKKEIIESLCGILFVTRSLCKNPNHHFSGRRALIYILQYGVNSGILDIDLDDQRQYNRIANLVKDHIANTEPPLIFDDVKVAKTNKNIYKLTKQGIKTGEDWVNLHQKDIVDNLRQVIVNIDDEKKRKYAEKYN